MYYNFGSYSFSALYLAAKFLNWSEYVRDDEKSGFICPGTKLLAKLVEKWLSNKSFCWLWGGVPGGEDGVELRDLKDFARRMLFRFALI